VSETKRRSAFLRERDELTLLAVHAHPNSTTRELAVELALSPAQTYLSLRRLRELGEVLPTESWPATWVIAPRDAVFDDFEGAENDQPPPYPDAYELVSVRRVDASLCVHLLESFEQAGAVGPPTHELIGRLKSALESGPRATENCDTIPQS
jgi:hypothetical protein